MSSWPLSAVAGLVPSGQLEAVWILLASQASGPLIRHLTERKCSLPIVNRDSSNITSAVDVKLNVLSFTSILHPNYFT